ncbi:hypothetical protein MKX03_012565 [Papaver bracteatum]|nr:hypothetical protein MKX03_012565 [Papaver bracteatum]
MNNEDMDEMDSNPYFPETITNYLLQTTLEETTTHAGESSVPTRNKKELTNEQQSNKGRLQKCSVLMAAQLFSISESTVKRIWKRGKDCKAKNLPFDVSSQKPTRVGPKPKKVDFSKIMEM